MTIVIPTYSVCRTFWAFAIMSRQRELTNTLIPMCPNFAQFDLKESLLYYIIKKKRRRIFEPRTKIWLSALLPLSRHEHFSSPPLTNSLHLFLLQFRLLDFAYRAIIYFSENWSPTYVISSSRTILIRRSRRRRTLLALPVLRLTRLFVL